MTSWQTFNPIRHGGGAQTGVHKTGVRGFQDTRQIVYGKTNDIENNDKKGGSKVQTLNKRRLMKKTIWHSSISQVPDL